MGEETVIKDRIHMIYTMFAIMASVIGASGLFLGMVERYENKLEANLLLFGGVFYLAFACYLGFIL